MVTQYVVPIKEKFPAMLAAVRSTVADRTVIWLDMLAQINAFAKQGVAMLEAHNAKNWNIDMLKRKPIFKRIGFLTRDQSRVARCGLVTVKRTDGHLVKPTCLEQSCA